MRRAYVSIPEGQVHYQTDGSGDALLLLHSTPRSSDEYVRVIPVLAQSYWVLAMDTMGYGKSDVPQRPYEVTDYAQSVVDFLKSLGITKTSIVGHLTGATIAVEVAANHPELVEKLVLYDFVHFTPEVRQSLLGARRFRPMELKEDGSHMTKIWQNLVSSYPDSASLEECHGAFVAHMMAGTRAEDGHLALWRYATESRLPLIKSPTLLLYGNNQGPFFEGLEVAKSLIPRCRTKVMEGWSMFIAQRQPEEFVQTFIEFLRNPVV